MLIRESTPLIGNNIIQRTNLSDATELPTKGNQSIGHKYCLATENRRRLQTKFLGNQSIGQYLSVHKDSFSHSPTNRRLEEAVV
ncbi:hypothetical protein AVEN_110826-1, partial [Araneus ventricosus]